MKFFKIFFVIILVLCSISNVAASVMRIRFAKKALIDKKALIEKNQIKVINGKKRIIKKY